MTFFADCFQGFWEHGCNNTALLVSLHTWQVTNIPFEHCLIVILWHFNKHLSLAVVYFSLKSATSSVRSKRAESIYHWCWQFLNRFHCLLLLCCCHIGSFTFQSLCSLCCRRNQNELITLLLWGRLHVFPHQQALSSAQTSRLSLLSFVLKAPIWNGDNGWW